MKTNLAYIGAATNQAVTRELENPQVPAAVEQKAIESSLAVVAGFAVKDDAAAARAMDQAREQRRGRAATFKKDRDEVTAQLNQLGITPLAVVPMSAWERLCSVSGLFCLAPNSYGEIHVNTAMLDKFKHRSRNIPDIAGLSFVIGAMVLSATIASVTFDTSWLAAAFVSVVAGLSAYAVASVAVGSKESLIRLWLRNAAAKAQIALYVQKPWDKLLTEFVTGASARSRTVRIVLPEPPADVAAVLLTARSLQLKVAAVASAIAFAESPGDLLNRELREDYRHELAEREVHLEKERAYREWLKHDPIVYREHGSAVAIIAQFGDFPIEKEVVDLVVNSEQLI